MNVSEAHPSRSASGRREVAVIGAGVAGLGCAHLLHRHCAVTIFEQDPRVGGHSHTVDERDEAGRLVAFDTGFMVYNEVTYPRLTRLFAELGVPTQPTSMSFSVRHDPADIEYCGSSINLLFAQRANLLRPRFWRFLRRIDRFNREAVAALQDPSCLDQPLEEFVRTRGYGEDFLQLYLLPMGCAVWSTPPAQMLKFPTVTLLRFFHNHGFLGLHTQHPWRTVTGGARAYVERLTAPFRDRIQTGRPVRAVRRTACGAELTIGDDGERRHFDDVILACHADQALALLADADPLERRLLGAFRYERNETLVHTDASVMPRRRRTWASWNYRIRSGADGRLCPSIHYWMNNLQGVSDATDFFVSLNAAADIDPRHVRRRLSYEHPLFDSAALAAQRELPLLNHRAGRQCTFFCGSYFRYGFHEDALASACAAAEAVLGCDPWPRAQDGAAPLPATSPSIHPAFTS